MKELIGRKEEIEVLEEAINSDEAELISIIGRRRVGKTFLVETFFKDRIDFQIAGIQGTSLSVQLQNFAAQLTKFYKKQTSKPVPLIQKTSNWFDAFLLLIEYLEAQKNEQKQVVFFDELPWLSSQRSGFLSAFSYFWNSWAARENIVVLICGSAASWMIKKVVHHKGGLHNRITKRLILKPFTLSETEEYLKSRKIHFDRYHILQLFMAMGGIPHYLKEIKGGKSATQNIDQICFSKTGLLNDEFSKLYSSLFANPENHISVIRILAAKWKGLTRKEIVEKGKIPEGGTVQRVLEELEQSGFISIYLPFGKKKKDKLYRLTDEYSLFYLQFIEGKFFREKQVWERLSQSQSYKTWSGYAFESICLKHIPSIKKALGISGIYSEASSYFHKGTGERRGIQIDLLIDRSDHVINLFEIKFYNTTYTLTKKEATELRDKMGLFRIYSKTRKQIFWSLISTFGIEKNMYSLDIINHSLTLEDLFEE